MSQPSQPVVPTSPTPTLSPGLLNLEVQNLGNSMRFTVIAPASFATPPTGIGLSFQPIGAQTFNTSYVQVEAQTLIVDLPGGPARVFSFRFG